MTHYIILGLLSPLICVLGYVPYVYSIIKNKITPHPFSWFLWAILGFVTLVTYIGVGAKETIPLAVLNFFGPLFIFFFTIKYWKGGFSRFDYVCLALSLVSITIYIVFRTAAIALTINLLGDLFASFPTIRKTYNDPKSENILTWICFFIGNLLSLFAIKDITYGVLVFPLYLTLIAASMFLLIIRKKFRFSSIKK